MLLVVEGDEATLLLLTFWDFNTPAFLFFCLNYPAYSPSMSPQGLMTTAVYIYISTADHPQLSACKESSRTPTDRPTDGAPLSLSLPRTSQSAATPTVAAAAKPGENEFA